MPSTATCGPFAFVTPRHALANELGSGHGALFRMMGSAMIEITLIVGQADHQMQGLAH